MVVQCNTTDKNGNRIGREGEVLSGPPVQTPVVQFSVQAGDLSAKFAPSTGMRGLKMGKHEDKLPITAVCEPSTPVGRAL
jgi:hypothetical protein